MSADTRSRVLKRWTAAFLPLEVLPHASAHELTFSQKDDYQTRSADPDHWKIVVTLRMSSEGEYSGRGLSVHSEVVVYVETGEAGSETLQNSPASPASPTSLH